MIDDVLRLDTPWLPGSFTKNFAWGSGEGLKRLYENIRIGFDDTLSPVPRAEYRRRVVETGRPDLIPINFFLFNTVRDGTSYLEADELVFQALSSPHSPRFDKLAMFAFNFAHVGRWQGQKIGQRYPAVWATSYIVDRLARDYRWDTTRINADDIERYLRALPRFQAEIAHHKVATNLNYFYNVGGLSGMAARRIERWWVDALFLALDRIVADRAIDGATTPMEILPNLLSKNHFLPLTGPVTTEKSLAIAHLIGLYSICGGSLRFNAERVREIVAVELPSYAWQLPNDDRPQGALHPTNPRILKTIPRECGELAKLAGFDIVLPDDLENLDPDFIVRQRAADAVDSLRRDNIRPVMSPEELHKLTRGE